MSAILDKAFLDGFSRCSQDTPWIGVDLDGTLAQYRQGAKDDEIGEPIEPMMERVRQWIAEGRTVKIFTARAAIPKQIRAVKAWLVENGLPQLEVTNAKDFAMIELWDDRCVQVKVNLGIPAFGNAPQPAKRTARTLPRPSRLHRRNPRPVAKILLAIGRFATGWSRVPQHEFIPMSGGR